MTTEEIKSVIHLSLSGRSYDRITAADHELLENNIIDYIRSEYAAKSDLPTKVSAFENDMPYVTRPVLDLLLAEYMKSSEVIEKIKEAEADDLTAEYSNDLTDYPAFTELAEGTGTASMAAVQQASTKANIMK